MSSLIDESKYEPIEVSESKEDLEVAQILSNVAENTVENGRGFSSLNESDIPHLDLSNNLPKPSSQKYPLDPASLLQTTLLDLITKMVYDHELQRKYELALDARYIDCLKEIAEKHPIYFGSFENSLSSIVKDGRISVADFPEIVKMVIELYTIMYSVHPRDIVDMCANVLKTVFFIAVKEKLIIVENENEVIGVFDNFIESIVDLLKMQIQLSSTFSDLTCNFHFWPFKC
jgi:hypothetical protein